MDYLSHNVSVNLKRIRQSKGMSLDQVAEQTGVSKSMLAQIERGEGNPTLSTLWKISNGMKVPFVLLHPCLSHSPYVLSFFHIIMYAHVCGCGSAASFASLQVSSPLYIIKGTENK